MSLIALLLVPIAFVLQGLGYTGTCTQGANAPFLVGTVLSLPLLALSATVLAISAARNLRRYAPNGSALNGTTSLCTALVTGWMVVVNSELARDTLWLGLGACGVGYTPAGAFEREDVAIGIVYALVPALVTGLALFTCWTALPARLRRLD